MTLMLDHVDSSYICCVGLLYLQYAADPSTLWSWFEPYLYDEESVQIRQVNAYKSWENTEVVSLGEVDLPGTHAARMITGVQRDRDARPTGRGYDDYDRGYDRRGHDARGPGYDDDHRRGRYEGYRGRGPDYRRNEPRCDRASCY